MDWLSIFRTAGSGAKQVYLSRKERKQVLLYDFILEAIREKPSCLVPYDHEAGTVSFDTIDLRIRLLQDDEPERASQCGIPAIDDPLRQQRLREMLREMVIAGKLQRCEVADRWRR